MNKTLLLAGLFACSLSAQALALGDVGQVKDSKPVDLKDLPADQRAKVLAKLKATNCFGIKSGVTTALVKAENLCGAVVEVIPVQAMRKTLREAPQPAPPVGAGYC